MPELDFDAVVEVICKEDSRYHRQAYALVRDGLHATVQAAKKKERDNSKKRRHVAGPELLHGLRVYILEQYGPMSKSLLDAWGVRRCGDFGEIVFNLIEYNVFSKTATDQREDFADIFTFDDAFVKPYLPQRARAANHGAAPARSEPA